VADVTDVKGIVRSWSLEVVFWRFVECLWKGFGPDVKGPNKSIASVILTLRSPNYIWYKYFLKYRKYVGKFIRTFATLRNW
jgi:hypothetical protein